MPVNFHYCHPEALHTCASMFSAYQVVDDISAQIN